MGTGEGQSPEPEIIRILLERDRDRAVLILRLEGRSQVRAVELVGVEDHVADTLDVESRQAVFGAVRCRVSQHGTIAHADALKFPVLLFADDETLQVVAVVDLDVGREVGLLNVNGADAQVVEDSLLQRDMAVGTSLNPDGLQVRAVLDEHLADVAAAAIESGLENNLFQSRNIRYTDVIEVVGRVDCQRSRLVWIEVAVRDGKMLGVAGIDQLDQVGQVGDRETVVVAEFGEADGLQVREDGEIGRRKVVHQVVQGMVAVVGDFRHFLKCLRKVFVGNRSVCSLIVKSRRISPGAVFKILVLAYDGIRQGAKVVHDRGEVGECNLAFFDVEGEIVFLARLERKSGRVGQGDVGDAAIRDEGELQRTGIISFDRHQEKDAGRALAGLQVAVVKHHGYFRGSGAGPPTLRRERGGPAGRGDGVGADQGLALRRFNTRTSDVYRGRGAVVQRDVERGHHRIVVQHDAALALGRETFVDGRHVGVAHVGVDVSVLGGRKGQVDFAVLYLIRSDVVGGVDAVEVVDHAFLPDQGAVLGSYFASTLYAFRIDLDDMVIFGKDFRCAVFVSVHQDLDRISVQPVDALASVDDLAGVFGLGLSIYIGRRAEHDDLACPVADKDVAAGDKHQHGQHSHDECSDSHT